MLFICILMFGFEVAKSSAICTEFDNKLTDVNDAFCKVAESYKVLLISTLEHNPSEEEKQKFIEVYRLFLLSTQKQNAKGYEDYLKEYFPKMYIGLIEFSIGDGSTKKCALSPKTCVSPYFYKVSVIVIISLYTKRLSTDTQCRWGVGGENEKQTICLMHAMRKLRTCNS